MAAKLPVVPQLPFPLYVYENELNMPISKLEEESMDKAEELESCSAVIESSKQVEPGIEDQWKFCVEGLKKYEKFLRDGYIDIYCKESEYQLERSGLKYAIQFDKNSKALQNYELYEKHLIQEHNKIIDNELTEEARTRKYMLSFCTAAMKWSRTKEILDCRQNIVMRQKKVFFDNKLQQIAEKRKIMLCYNEVINAGKNLILQELPE